MVRFFNLLVVLIFSFALFGESSIYVGAHLDQKVFAEDIEIDFSEQDDADEDSSLVKLAKGNSRYVDECKCCIQEVFSKSLTGFSVKSKNSFYLLYCNLNTNIIYANSVL